MEWDRGAAAIFMTVLPVGSALADQFEAKVLENGLDLARFQNRDAPQRSGYPNSMGSNELRVECRFTILKEHLHDFGQVRKKFINSGTLRMSAGPPGDVPHKKACVCVTFNNSSVIVHGGAPFGFREKLIRQVAG